MKIEDQEYLDNVFLNCILSFGVPEVFALRNWILPCENEIYNMKIDLKEVHCSCDKYKIQQSSLLSLKYFIQKIQLPPNCGLLSLGSCYTTTSP